MDFSHFKIVMIVNGKKFTDDYCYSTTCRSQFFSQKRHLNRKNFNL